MDRLTTISEVAGMIGEAEATITDGDLARVAVLLARAKALLAASLCGASEASLTPAAPPVSVPEVFRAAFPDEA